MSTHRDMLLRRAQKAREAEPEAPDKPLTLIQMYNRDNLRAWRERMRLYNKEYRPS